MATGVGGDGSGSDWADSQVVALRPRDVSRGPYGLGTGRAAFSGPDWATVDDGFIFLPAYHPTLTRYTLPPWQVDRPTRAASSAPFDPEPEFFYTLPAAYPQRFAPVRQQPRRGRPDQAEPPFQGPEAPEDLSAWRTTAAAPPHRRGTGRALPGTYDWLEPATGYVFFLSWDTTPLGPPRTLVRSPRPVAGEVARDLPDEAWQSVISPGAAARPPRRLPGGKAAETRSTWQPDTDVPVITGWRRTLAVAPPRRLPAGFSRTVTWEVAEQTGAAFQPPEVGSWLTQNSVRPARHARKVHYACARPDPRAAGTIIVAGPYWAAAGQIFTAGAAAGDVSGG